MGRLVITCDGSSLGNPGPGGWAWVISPDCWAAGGHRDTTNNLMELRAVFEALSATPAQQPLLLQTDSSYVISVFTEWLPGWKARGWRTASRKPVANRQAIMLVEGLLIGRDVQWRHVRGHAGHVENELADMHARAAATSMRDGSPIRTGAGGPDCVRAHIQK